MRYHNITKDDMLNGDGLRVVLWVSGCSHGCEGCHNPITWDPNGGETFDEKAKKELFTELEKSYISGITLSGGDPLHNSNRFEIENLVKETRNKFPGKTIWVYTGSSWETVRTRELMNYIDVLVDGEYDCAKRDTTLHWRGSSNQRVIDVPKSLKAKEVVLHCR